MVGGEGEFGVGQPPVWDLAVVCIEKLRGRRESGGKGGWVLDYLNTFILTHAQAPHLPHHHKARVLDCVDAH